SLAVAPDSVRRHETQDILGELLDFYDALDNRWGQPNGSIRAAVQPVGEPDEMDLDADHALIDVMEGVSEVVTGRAHRHSAGCSFPFTDGSWLRRQDFPHYLGTHHVSLPGAFIDQVRS
ncbi:hypothetical protein ACFRLW_35030, partial [Streptomyces sp. NPDC056728]